jgi:hypothetical protein
MIERARGLLAASLLLIATLAGAAPGDRIAILYDAFGDRPGFDLP